MAQPTLAEELNEAQVYPVLALKSFRTPNTGIEIATLKISSDTQSALADIHVFVRSEDGQTARYNDGEWYTP